MERFSKDKVTCWPLHWSLHYPLFFSFASCFRDVASCLPRKKERKKEYFPDTFELFLASDFNSFLELIFRGVTLLLWPVLLGFFLAMRNCCIFLNFFLIIYYGSPLWWTIYHITWKKKKKSATFQLLELLPYNHKSHWNEEHKTWKIIFFPTVAKSLQLWRC